MADTRKPEAQVREPAQVVLNRFLKENNIVIGTQTPKIETTNSGQILISPPTVIAAYASDISNKETIN